MTIKMNYVNYDFGFFGFSKNQTGTVLGYLSDFLRAHPEIIANEDAFYGENGFLNGKKFDLNTLDAIGNSKNNYLHSPEKLKEKLSPEEFYQLMIDFKSFYDEANKTKNKEKMFCADTLLYALYSEEIGKPGDSPARLVRINSNNYFEARKYARNGTYTIQYDKFAQTYFDKFAQEPAFERNYFVQQMVADYKKGKRGSDIKARIQKALDAGYDVNEPLQVPGFQTSSLLYLATLYNDTDTMRFLIENKADATFKNANNRTPLFYARSKEAVELLVSQNASVDEIDKDGLTPLSYALKEKNPVSGVASALLAAGADPLYTDHNGNMPLFYLGDKNSPEATESRLVMQDAMRIAMQNNNYYNAFALSYAEGDKSVRKEVETAIKNGYDIHFHSYATNAAGPTLLHLAAQYGDIETIKLLQQHGMDINTLTKAGENALCYAKTPEAIDALIGLGVDVNGGKNKPLITAIEYGHNPQLIQKLIESGADINLQDSNGSTALSIAKEMAQHEQGEKPIFPNAIANFEILQKTQQQAEEKKQYEYNKQIYEQLVSLYQGTKQTASYQANIEIRNLLSESIKNGFDVNFTLPGEKYNNTPLLHYAFENTHNLEGMICYDLLQAGANLKQADGNGQTILHKITPKDSQTMLSEIIRTHGLNINAKDNKGATPLIQFAQFHPEAANTINFFIKEGADPLEKDSQGKTALDYVNEKEKTPDTNLSSLYLTHAIISKGPVGNQEEYNKTVYDLLVPLYQQENFDASMLDEAISKGFDINFTTSTHNHTPFLHYVFEKEGSIDTGICQNLIAHGANPKQTDGSGKTLLHKASWVYGFEPLIQKYGLDINAQDNNGVTPLMQLIQSHPEESGCAVHFVKDWGANPLLTDNQGKTALDYAKETSKTRAFVLTALTEATNAAEMAELQRNATSEETRSIQERTAARKEFQARELMKRAEQGIPLNEDEQRLVQKYQAVLQERAQTSSTDLTNNNIPQPKPLSASDENLAKQAVQALNEHIASKEALAQADASPKTNTETNKETAVEPTSEVPQPQPSETSKPEEIAVTIRHQYGETLQEHEQITAHATKRNQRISARKRKIALENIQKMEELGLIAKGPNGASTADVRLYQLYQSTQILSPKDTIHMEIDGKIEKIKASDLLTNESGHSNQQIYNMLTTKKLSKEELEGIREVLDCTEYIINKKGNVINEGSRKKPQPPMFVMNLEETPIGNEVVYYPSEEENESETTLAQENTEKPQEELPQEESPKEGAPLLVSTETETKHSQAEVSDADFPTPRQVEPFIQQEENNQTLSSILASAENSSTQNSTSQQETRHQYGDTLQEHEQIIRHATTRNQRIHTNKRETALQNIQKMEELGLIAKGPNGASMAQLRLYQLHQSALLLSPNDTLQIEIDGKIKKVKAKEVLTDKEGHSHKQIYNLLTTEQLSDNELRDLVDVIDQLETVITAKGNVANHSKKEKSFYITITEPKETQENDAEKTSNEQGDLRAKLAGAEHTSSKETTVPFYENETHSI